MIVDGGLVRAWSALRRVLATETGPVDMASAVAAELAGEGDEAPQGLVDLLLAVPPELRRVGFDASAAALHCTLRELVAGLWPRGWNRGRDWPRLMAGLDELRRLGDSAHGAARRCQLG